MQNFTALGQKIEVLGSKWANSNLEKLGFRLKNLHFFYDEAMSNDYGLILELDANGRLLGSLHSIDGTNFRLSEVVEGPTENPYERVLYMGSYVNPYILKLSIPNFTQDYQQKQKQQSSFGKNASTITDGHNHGNHKNSGHNENGVDFSMLPYATRRAISAAGSGDNGSPSSSSSAAIASLADMLYDDDDGSLSGDDTSLMHDVHHNQIGKRHDRRSRKDTSRYSSSTKR